MPDRGQKYVLYVENGVLNYTIGKQAEDADATVTMDRAVLDSINLGQTTIADAMLEGTVDVEGNPLKLVEFLGLIDRFDPWFNVVTP